MLARAIVPLVRPTGRVLAPRVLAIAPYQRRWYAKDKSANRFLNKQQPSSAKQPSSSTGSAQKPADDVAANAEQKEPSKAEEQSTPEEQTFQLPDLTQGIPSTLDAELEQARHRTSAKPSLNITEDPSAEQPTNAEELGGGSSEGLPKTEYISSADRKRQQQFKYGYLAIFAGIGAGAMFLGRNWGSEEEEKKHKDAPSGLSITAFYDRFKARLSDYLNFYQEPAFKKLLPDPDPDPLNQPPFTLVLSLEDLLIHSEWTREHGWRIAKRPGVDYFLRYLSQYYEFVIWTSQPSMMADPVIRKFDPFRLLRFPLFREATLYKNGEHVKDLSYLNRDLSKVIIIDTVPGHAANQPENAIILPKWTGDPKDRTLPALVPFLEYIAVMGIDDTRAVLKSFEGKDIPAEFAKREQIMREKFEAKMAAEKKNKSGMSLSSLTGALGLKGAGQDEKPKMLWDQVRERGRVQYELFDQQIKENGAKWLAELEAEEKKAQEEAMKNMKGSLPFLGGGSK